MIGDGKCDEACNNESCGWDERDCGCAPGCSAGDYGQCKAACLVPDCAYDSLPGAQACPDLQLRQSAKAVQSYFKSALFYSFADLCTVPSCTLAEWKTSFSTCVEECSASVTCLGSYGHCGVCPLPHCDSCVADVCLACSSGFLSFFGVCMEECPATFQEHSLVPGLCSPSADSSTLQSPATYYVSPGQESRNVGTLEDPFASLSVALSAVHCRFSRVYLSRETHQLAQAMDNAYLRRTTYDSIYSRLPRDNSTYLEVLSLPSESPASPAVLSLDNLSPVTWHLFGTVRFYDVVFQGNATLEQDCDVCAYCPQVSADSGYRCEQFHSLSFISVEGEVTFDNVTFRGFQQQFQRLISISSGSLLISNSQFRGITVNKSVIGQYGATVVVSGCTVERLNSGYSTGFLWSRSAMEVAVLNSTLRYNDLGLSGFLLQVANALSLRLEDCRFEYNLGGVLQAVSSLPLPSTPESFASTRIQVIGVVARHNAADSLLEMRNDGISVLLSRCEFSDNRSTRSELISLQSSSTLKERDIRGRNVTVVEGSERKRVFLPPMETQVRGVAFRRNSVLSGVMSIDNLANVEVSDVSIVSNGDSLGLSRQCSAIASFSRLQGFALLNTSLHGNYCAYGSAGIVITGMLQPFSVTALSAVNNSANSEKVGILHVHTQVEATLLLLSVIGNRNTALTSSAIVELQSTALLSVSGSEFSANTCSRGTVHAAGYLSLRDSRFSSNWRGLSYSPSPSVATLALSQVEFFNNTATYGGGVYITGTKAEPVHLLISNSRFERNNSTQAGACIHLSARLTPTATVTGTVFDSNWSGNACIVASFPSGVLTVDRSVFRRNVGTNCAVLLATHPASTADLLSRTVLQHSLIELNAGEAIIVFLPTQYSEGESRNLTFRNNTSSRAVFLELTSWVERDSRFVSNSFKSSGGVFWLVKRSVGDFRESSFIGNSGGLSGQITLVEGSSLHMSGCSFLRNFAVFGTALMVTKMSEVHSANCRYADNTALLQGGAVFATQVLGGLLSTFTSDTFTNNFGSNSEQLTASQANVTLQNCTFRGLRDRVGAAIGVYLSTVAVLSSTFADMASLNGGFIRSPTPSVLVVSGCAFNGGRAVGSGGAIFCSSTSLTVANSSFEGLSAVAGAAIALTFNSTFHISNCSFTRTTASVADGGAVSIADSKGLVSQSTFGAFANGAVAVASSDLEIEFSSFSGKSHAGGRSGFGAALRATDCPQVTVRSSAFYNLSATSGSCMYFTSTQSHALYSLHDVVVSACVGEVQGAVAIIGGNATVSGSHFTGNTAAEGAALSLSCPSPPCAVAISSSVFIANLASIRGGAISWTGPQPHLQNLTFLGNSAGYGDDVASFPAQLALSEAALQLVRVPSGQKAQVAIRAHLLDHYGQVVTTDNSSLADLFTGSDSSVTGDTQVVASQGEFVFSNYAIVHVPGSNTSVFLRSSALPDQLQVPVYMRNCIAGEWEVDSLCYQCPPGKYSLTPSDECADCPQGVECFGEAQLAPKPGYWLSPKLEVFTCLEGAACLGSSVHTNRCAEGYFGNLCHGCIAGYSRSSRNLCSPCPPLATNAAVTTAVCVAALLALFVLIRLSLAAARNARSHYSVHLKILVSYLQLLAVTAELNFSWPRDARAMLAQQQRVGQVNQQAMSIDCFLDSGHADTQRAAVFTKVVVYTCAPLAVVALVVLLWRVLLAIRRRQPHWKCHAGNSLLLVFFLMYPSELKQMLELFSCREIAGGFWLNSYLTIRCWDSAHRKVAFAAALPSIIVWGIAVPQLALIALVRLRKRLDTVETKLSFGYLYQGFEARTFYWEFVVLVRKVVVMLLSVFLVSVSIHMQALLTTMSLVAALLLHEHIRPYAATSLNTLEQRSILAAAVSLYCGLFFITDDLSTKGQIALFAVIVAANAYFFLHWIVGCCGRRVCRFLVTAVLKQRRRIYHGAVSAI